MSDLAEMIEFHARAHPHKAAIITPDSVLSYEMLWRGMLTAQSRFAANGLKPGDRVGINVPNPIGHVTLMCALHRAGIASASMEQPQADSLATGVIDAMLTHAPVAGTPARMILVDETWFSDPTTSAIVPAAVSDEALCRMVYSSGTTGQPKIIGVTRRAVAERIETYAIRLSTPSWDRLLCMPGLSTNYGYSFTITALWLGRTILFPLGPVARDMIISYQVEILVASTHQISVIVKAQEDHLLTLESLRAVHIGGSVAYAPLLTRIRMLVCNNVLCGYGSTEGGTVAYAPADMVHGIDRAVGALVPWVEAETIDADDKPQNLGVEGQIRLRTMGQGRRLIRNDEGDFELEANDWFYPGDQGIIYRNGLMLITGRVNELINRGGVKIAPDAIEEHLKKHPDVIDAAAVGILDQVGLEQIWMAVVSKRSVDIAALFEHFRDSQPQLTPDRIFPIDAIPRNRLGKIARESLKEELMRLEESQALALR
jgi:acyl-coenzyme A synthetase/AMP-(fatty) acid ligase